MMMLETHFECELDGGKLEKREAERNQEKIFSLNIMTFNLTLISFFRLHVFTSL